MSAYQYNLEVANVYPVDSFLAVDGKPRFELVLSCARRDATVTCTEVPSSFEVRNTPVYDFLSLALLTTEGGGGDDRRRRTVAVSEEPLLIGGPRRTVGAVWLPLKPVSVADTEALAMVERVFIAWSLVRMDGAPLVAGDLESCTSPLISSSMVAPLEESTAEATEAKLPPYTSSKFSGTTTTTEDSTSVTAVRSTQRKTSMESRYAQSTVVTVTHGAGNSTTDTSASSGTPTPAQHQKSTPPEPPFSSASSPMVAGGVLRRSADPMPPLSGETSRKTLGERTPEHLGRPPSAPKRHRASATSGTSTYGVVTSERTARVSIRMDVERAAYRDSTEGHRGSSCTVPRHDTSEVQLPARIGQESVADEDGGSAALGELPAAKIDKDESAVLLEFPFCSVSVTDDAGSATELHRTEADPSELVTSQTPETRSSTRSMGDAVWVDYYASSTQAIGPVPLASRLQNLYTVPSPLLLDRLQYAVEPPTASSPSSSVSTVDTAPVASYGLWRPRDRHVAMSRWIGDSVSAQDAIRREHEAKRRNALEVAASGQAKDAARSSSPISAASPLARVKGHLVDVRPESTLVLLRQEALNGLRRKRISY